MAEKILTRAQMRELGLLKQTYRVRLEGVEAAVLPKEKTDEGLQYKLADYYRDGGASSNDETNVAQSARLIGDFERGEATIRVWSTRGNTDLIPAYTKFILETSQESHRERAQIIETFGDFYVYFFGESPAIYNYSGLLVNAENVNWVYEWQYYYENYLRGTKCAEVGAQIILTYGNIQIEGFILNFNTAHNAVNEKGVPIQFSMVKTKRTGLLPPEDFGLRESVTQYGYDDSTTSPIEAFGPEATKRSSGYKETKDMLGSGSSAFLM